MDDPPAPAIMDILPDGVVQLILARIHTARHAASCSCVCRRWRELITHTPALVFSRNLCSPSSTSDLAVTRLVLSTAALTRLVIYCPISAVTLLACVSHAKNTLTELELRVDNNGEGSGKATLAKLECVTGAAALLRTVRLWGGVIPQCPAGWRGFTALRTLEIVGARMRDAAVRGMLAACSGLRTLALLGCDGVGAVRVEMEWLESCRLDFCGSGECEVAVAAPRLRFLEVQGAARLRLVGESALLEHLMVAKQSGIVKSVEVDRLPALRSLSLRGLQWSWEAVEGLLRTATEVQSLFMKIEFCGDATFDPFPEVDLLHLLHTHPKLRLFHAHGAMFAALACPNPPVHGSVVAPCLEEVTVTVRSALNAEKKMQVLETVVRSSPALRRLVVRVSQMKNLDAIHPQGDDLFPRLAHLQHRHGFITIE